MMQSIHSYGGVTATVYVMQKGEKIPRHQHTYAHTTSVAAGQTAVEVWDVDHLPRGVVIFMVMGNSKTLSPNIDHEIRALVDGTVVVNLAIGSSATGVPGPTANAGGVTLHDGTIVEHGTVATIGRCFGC